MLAFKYLKNKLSLFFREILWDDEQLTSNQNLTRYILMPLRIGVIVSKGFYRHECFGRAMTLTYISLLNLIPLLAIALATLSFFAIEHASDIENYLMDFFSPAGTANSNGAANAKANLFVQNIMKIVKNVNTKQISSYGYFFLFISSLSLISSIEYSLNHIWGIKKGRSFLRKAGSYSIVLMGLLTFIILSISLSATYQTYAKVTEKGIENTLNNFKGNFYLFDLMINVSSYAIHHLGIVLSHFLQFFFAWLFFTLLFFYLPYTKVKLNFSIKSGLVTALLFELAKPIFTSYIQYFLVSSSIGKIYGALSFIPFAIFWIYIVWVIVLLGAELTYAFQNVKAYQMEFRLSQMNRKSKDLIVLKIVKEILVQQKNQQFFTIEELSFLFKVPIYFVEASVSLLVGGGLIEVEPKTEKIKIVDDQVTPGQVMIAMYHSGKDDKLELKFVSPELEYQMKDWESILMASSSKFEV